MYIPDNARSYPEAMLIVSSWSAHCSLVDLVKRAVTSAIASNLGASCIETVWECVENAVRLYNVKDGLRNSVCLSAEAQASS